MGRVIDTVRFGIPIPMDARLFGVTQCGIVGHILDACPTKPDIVPKAAKLLYGKWLRFMATRKRLGNGIRHSERVNKVEKQSDQRVKAVDVGGSDTNISLSMGREKFIAVSVEHKNQVKKGLLIAAQLEVSAVKKSKAGTEGDVSPRSAPTFDNPELAEVGVQPRREL
ncbi:hypothetical protein V6N12_065828 [Hibiscus sabdariffa]|uniref:Uncharacterized protein n=1 Tax=Hibiscus sabdariffa TaxID=183260 RepID=A0ABR2GA15_9ROSI